MIIIYPANDLAMRQTVGMIVIAMQLQGEEFQIVMMVCRMISIHLECPEERAVVQLVSLGKRLHVFPQGGLVGSDPTPLKMPDDCIVCSPVVQVLEVGRLQHTRVVNVERQTLQPPCSDQI